MASSQINVLFHGLFVMEYTTINGSGVLEAYAPQMKKNSHTLLGGVRGNLVDVTGQGPIDWTTVSGLQGNSTGSPSDLNSTQIMRFSRKSTLVGDMKSKDQGRVIRLPWPKNIFALRLDDTGKFNSDPASTVGNEIKNNCGSKVGLVSAANYDYTVFGPPLPGWTPSMTFHFFHSPDKFEDTDDVNADLIELKSIFTNGTNFNLSMVDTNLPVTPIDPTIPLPPGVVGIGPEDELSNIEPITTPLNISISKLLLHSLKGTNIGNRKEDLRDIIEPVMTMLNPANCPNFFLMP